MFKIITIIFLILFGISFQLMAQIPQENLCLWLSADSGVVLESGKVKEWTDLSTNANNAIQNDTNKQPEIINNITQLNNHPTIRFDGIDDFMVFNEISNIRTIFFVFKHRTGTGTATAPILGHSTLYDFHGGTTDKLFMSWTSQRIKDGICSINNVETDALEIKKPMQVSLLKIITTGNVSAEMITNDRNISSRVWDGDIAEIIIFSETLNDSLSNIVEEYIRDKYSPQINLGSDIYIPYSYCDTISITAESRFTNYLWNTGDTTQTISVNQSGQYSVTVTDIFGFESSDSLMVYYPSPAIPTDTLICYGDTIKLNAGLQDTNYTFLWQDNTTTDSIMPISQAGEYYVQITDTFGCVYNSDTAHITIDNYPETTNLGADDTLCVGQYLYLQTGANETVNYLWNNGDTTNYTVINIAGNYSVTATNAIGCVATDTVNIQISGYAPIPGFDYANTCFTDSTAFTDTSFTIDNSNIISWQWDFGNGNTSNLQNPELQYLDTGNYQVILTVSTDSTCENTITKNIRINPLPIANYSNTQLCEKNNIQFTNQSTVATGNITNYLWHFGNGDTSIVENPTYNYNSYGNYTIQLFVNSNANCKDTITQNIEVKPSPETNFYTGPTCKGEIVNFYNTTQTLVYNQILEYNWNFGDGNNSSNENVNHIFDINDTINTVSLYAKTINGCSLTKTKQITMHNIPVAKITTEGVCQRNYFTLTENSYVINDSILSYNWQINNEFYTEQNPTITITDAGYTNISLKVSSINGCIGTDITQIPIYELPNPNFLVNPEYGIVNEITIFTPTDTIDNIWDLGNGHTSTDTIVYTTYTDSGTYIINHYSTNHYNCTDSVSKEYLVVVPRQDIAITDIETEIKNNKLYTSVNIINLGNLPIYDIELTVSPENQSPITENWVGELFFGAILPYTFNAIYNITDAPSYVCVTADLIGKYPDQNPNDNTKCTNENSDFELFPIYPNPTTNNITVKFGLPDKGQVDIILVDNLGKIISKLYSQETQKGISIVFFNLPKLNDGAYTIQVKYKSTFKSMKFIKSAK